MARGELGGDASPSLAANLQSVRRERIVEAWATKSRVHYGVARNYSSIAEISGHPIAQTFGLALVMGGLLAPSRGLGLIGCPAADEQRRPGLTTELIHGRT